MERKPSGTDYGLSHDQTNVWRFRVIFRGKYGAETSVIDHKESHPQAYQVVLDSFYIDDGLIGADSIEDAIELRKELQEPFSLGGFTLRKWNASEWQVLASIPEDLVDPKTMQEIKIQNDYTKVWGIEWNF